MAMINHDATSEAFAIPLMVLDPQAAELMLEERRRLGQDRKDEVWNGTYIMSPDPNRSHQLLVGRLTAIFIQTQSDRDAEVYPGMNVTDRLVDWMKNYRCPDVVVLFPDNPAVRTETTIVGGPDFLVEVLSPNDSAREKLPFYGNIGTREALYLDPETDSAELYRLVEGNLKLVSKSTPATQEQCVSEALNLAFRLVSENDATLLEVRSTVDVSLSWRLAYGD